MIGLASSGEGKKSTTASSSGCTPLFLNAEPHSIGRTLPWIVAARSALCRRSTGISWPSKNSSSSASSCSAIASIIAWRHSCAVVYSSPSASVTGVVSDVEPRSSV